MKINEETSRKQNLCAATWTSRQHAQPRLTDPDDKKSRSRREHQNSFRPSRTISPPRIRDRVTSISPAPPPTLFFQNSHTSQPVPKMDKFVPHHDIFGLAIHRNKSPFGIFCPINLDKLAKEWGQRIVWRRHFNSKRVTTPKKAWPMGIIWPYRCMFHQIGINPKYPFW